MERDTPYESGEAFADEILEHLKSKERSLDEEQPLGFYLYLPTEEEARKCADEINPMGLDTEVEESEEEDGTWLCRSSAKMLPNRDRLIEIANKLLELETRFHGELDGWELSDMSLEDMFESLAEHFHTDKDMPDDFEFEMEEEEEDDEGMVEVRFDEELSPEADDFLEEACEELNGKQAALQSTWRIDAHNKWSFEQESAKLILDFEDGSVLHANAEILGSFHPGESTWEWAWNNPNVDPAITGDSRKAQEVGEKFEIGYLTNGRIPVDSEDLVAFLCAIGLKASEAEGIYTGESDGLRVYLTIKNLEWIKKGN